MTQPYPCKIGYGTKPQKMRAKLNIQLAMFWRSKPHAACKAPANKEQTKATTSTRWAQQIKTANHEKQQRSYVRPCIRSSETNQQWESKSRTKAAIKRKNKKHAITWDNKTRRPANVFIWRRWAKSTLYKYSFCSAWRLSHVFFMPLDGCGWVHRANSPVECAS